MQTVGPYRACGALAIARRLQIGLSSAALVAFAQALAIGGVALGPASGRASAQAVIDNNTIKLGVDQLGQLNVPGVIPSYVLGTTSVGLRYLPTGLGGPEAEATAHGCLCEGWGIAGMATGPFSASANNAVCVGGLTLNSFASTASTALSNVSTIGGELRIVHDFHPSGASANLYEVIVTITNTGTAPATNLVYRRNMDWDVEQSAYDEFSTIDTYPTPGGPLPPNVISTSVDGFVCSDPTAAPTLLTCTGVFVDCGPDDHGAQFDFALGTLNVGQSLTFTIFYGAAENEAAALNALGLVGAIFYSFGQPNLPGGTPDHGEPNTFIFAFGGGIFEDDCLVGDDFRDCDVADWNPSGVVLTVQTPGPSGDPADCYMRGADVSGASVVLSPTSFGGDWLDLLDGACGEFCFDFRVFDDSSPTTLNIAPGFVLEGGGFTARWVAGFTVTEDGGANPGWRQVCAPIGPLVAGMLPSSPDGAWTMVTGATADWDALISNVTAVRLGFDYTSTQNERVGWDNFCLRSTPCPCAEIGIDGDTLCVLDDSGNYTYTFDLTNISGVGVKHLLVLPPAGITAIPGVVTLPTTLAHGDTTSVTLTFNGGMPGEQMCFRLGLNDESFVECCSLDVCIEVPECSCGQVHDEVIEALGDGSGCFTYTFQVDNLFPGEIYHSFFIPISPSGVTFDEGGDDRVDYPPLQQFDSATVSVTICGAAPGEEVCFTLTMHNATLEECCAFEICIVAPSEGPGGASCPGDADGDGVVGFLDLNIVVGCFGQLGDVAGDLNADGFVDFADLNIVLGRFNTVCE